MSEEKTEESGHSGYLFAGFASLFAAAFMDNARGPILPVLCQQLHIPYETAGLFLTIGSIAAVLATFIMGRFLPRIGDRRTAIIGSLLAVGPGFIAPFVDNRFRLLVLGLMLGASVSLVGSLSSILTVRGSPVALRGRYLSIQQVMYGIGSLIAPLVFSALTHAAHAWWWLFVMSSALNLLLALTYVQILPAEKIPPALPPKTVSDHGFRAATWLTMLVFAFYVAGEVLASMWMSSLMVGHQGITAVDAGFYQMGFFLMMGVSRLLCFLLVKPRWESTVQISCLCCGILFALLGQQGFSWALPLVGVLGPFFPLSMARVSIQYPTSWKQTTILIYVAIQTALGLMHVSVGRAADSLGIEQAFLLSPVFLGLCLLLLIPNLKDRHKPVYADGLLGTRAG